jgi:hypothetical protein
MDAAIAGLIGAGIGAVAGLAGSLISHALSTRLQHRVWLRDKRNEAYAGTLRYLGRVLRKRSKISAEAGAILGADAVKEWFDDLNEAQTWMSSVSIYCSEAYRKTVSEAAQSLDEAINSLLNAGARAAGGKTSVLTDIDRIHDVILDIARKDMRRYIT